LLVTWLVAISVIYIHYSLLWDIHIPAKDEMEGQSVMVQEASKVIDTNSVVLTVDVTGNFLYGHFGDYLAAKKPLIIVPNYETDNSWFATKWNPNMPQLTYNDKGDIPGYYTMPRSDNNKITKEIDYVFIHGDYNQVLKDAKWTGVKDGLLKKYKLIYAAPDSGIHIFSLLVKSTSPMPNPPPTPNKIQGRAL
jgi:hypothetical protein